MCFPREEMYNKGTGARATDAEYDSVFGQLSDTDWNKWDKWGTRRPGEAIASPEPQQIAQPPQQITSPVQAGPPVSAGPQSEPSIAGLLGQTMQGGSPIINRTAAGVGGNSASNGV